MTSPTLPKKIHKYFDTISPSNPLNDIISELLQVGNKLNTARDKHADTTKLVKRINKRNYGFKLKLQEKEEPQSPIRASAIRKKLGIPEREESKVLSRNKICIKRSENALKISFDSAANYQDSNRNWGIHSHIKDSQENITHAAIYMPKTGEVYAADLSGSYKISFNQQTGKIRIKKIHIGELPTKFNAEVGSWHTKERAFVKTFFTLSMREEVGGSLRESGMKEVPFVGVSLNEFGYSMLGNLKPKDGAVGTFIAGQAGASIIRLPITSDSQGRDAVFAIHPDLTESVLQRFHTALKLSENDVTVGEPTVMKNIVYDFDR